LSIIDYFADLPTMMAVEHFCSIVLECVACVIHAYVCSAYFINADCDETEMRKN